MLVLSRQRDESIMIGDNIVITIVDIRGDKVRLGINAPSEVPVHRQEIMRPFSAKISVPAASIPKIFEGWLSRPLQAPCHRSVIPPTPDG